MNDRVQIPYKGHKIKKKAGKVHKDGTLAIQAVQFGTGNNNSGPQGKAKRFRSPGRRPGFAN